MKTTKTISRITMIIVCASMLTSCMTYKDAGNLNMVSCRNVDTHAKYELLKKNVEYTKQELKKVRTTTIESAVNDAVKKVEGGEYLMNAKIKVCIIPGSIYNGYQSTCFYAVEGDVWGVKLNNK
jgi:hypothetical protein